MFRIQWNCTQLVFFVGLLIIGSLVYADTPTLPVLITKSTPDGMTYHLSIKILVFLGLLTLLPALLITTTSFTRIIIVFSILRQAIGIPNVPSNQIIIGLSLIMTFYVMTPLLTKVNENSIQPYLQGQVSETVALEQSAAVLKTFMLKQARKTDLNLFAKLSKLKLTAGDYPFYIVMPAFITSELKTAFQIGFLIFLPFLIIDLVTASVLMSMGMMMLSPMVISLPFKVLFFVMVNGWSLMISSLVSSFRL